MTLNNPVTNQSTSTQSDLNVSEQKLHCFIVQHSVSPPISEKFYKMCMQHIGIFYRPMERYLSPGRRSLRIRF